MKRFGKGKSIFGAKTDEVLARKNDEYRYLYLKDLTPGQHQPRVTFEQWQMKDLLESIRANGIKEALVVTPVQQGEEVKYEIISGERRYRAALELELAQVPCLIREYYSEKEKAIDSVLLNDKRVDLNDMEWALHIDRLRNMGLTFAQISTRLARKSSTLRNLHRLTKLTKQTQTLIHENKLSMGHARALIGLTPEEEQFVVDKILTDKLSVRAVEALVRDMKEGEYDAVEEEVDYDSLNNKAFNQLKKANISPLSIKTDNQGRPIIKLHSYHDLEILIGKIK